MTVHTAPWLLLEIAPDLGCGPDSLLHRAKLSTGTGFVLPQQSRVTVSLMQRGCLSSPGDIALSRLESGVYANQEVPPNEHLPVSPSPQGDPE